MDAKVKRRRLLWWAAGSLLALVCVGLIWMAYRFSWSSTGFVGKTVWDWLQLLIIPLVLALGAVAFNQANAQTERQIAQQRYDQDQELALDKQREDLLQSYLDRMSELLLGKDLRTSKPENEVRHIARVRTISTLIRLDAPRVNYVFAFLREAGLIESSSPIISLHNINLSEADLRETDLSGANLSAANLFRADLSEADLRETDLSGATLNGANLREVKLGKAKLSEAKLTRADLSGANLRETDLSGAKLIGANLREIDLSGAKLSGANLTRADLSGAKLKGAIIEKEKLSAEQQAQAIWT